MKMKILISIIFIFLLTGCWNYRELNDLAICTGMSIDKKDDLYVVNVMIANSKKQEVSAKEGEAQTVIYEGIGKTITSAMDQIDTKIPKIIYLSHLDMVVISKEIALDGAKKSIDFLLRNPESRRRFYVIIAKDSKASDVIKVLSPLESFPSENIATNIQSSIQTGASTVAVNYNDYLKIILAPGVNPILTAVKVVGSPKEGEKITNLEQSKPKTIIELGEAALFKDDKFIAYASQKETIGINIITNKVLKTSLNIKCNNSYYVVLLDKLKVKSKPILNGQPKIELSVKATGAIAENNCDMDLTKPSTIDKINKETIKELEDQIKLSLNATMKNYKTDVLGFGNLFYKYHPKYFKTVKDDWDNIFSSLHVSIKTEVNIKNKGAAETTVRRLDHE